MKRLNVTINFDMDGTIADLYGVENWLDYLIAENTFPYEMARPLVRLSHLARRLNTLQRNGYNIAVISWLSKSGTEEYNRAVTEVKIEWLRKHLPSVEWDRITIVPYGTPKEEVTKELGGFQILIDDEQRNLDNWTNGATFNAQENIIEFLRSLGL